MLGIFFFSIIFSTIFNSVGLIVNLFIAVVTCKNWVKRHRLSSSDMILFGLAITRLLMLGLLFILNIIFIFISEYVERSVYMLKFFVLCWMFLDSSGLWFVTLLNTLYCVKITNFQNSIFLLLKWNLSLKISRLLLACVLIPAFTTFLYVVLSKISPSPESVTSINGTVFVIGEGILSLVTSLVLNSFLQFIINVTSASLLIYSLRRHIQKMQRNTTKFWNPLTEAHVGAMKLMIYFLILYIPYSFAMLLSYLPFVKTSLGAKAVCIIFSTLYPTGHSVLIVLKHSKLKTEAKKLFCFNKKWNFSKNSGQSHPMV
ncbi:taste receptor type 2 member 4 [Dasypus novemcinctus]|uniref:taste receptor type 2 member 4 n=1 Tax=Dasypus novemcinctus TaxID=9361 RepID=UPI0003291255|nr:taste receptor type 2 member 4 [Dasypus novemcinctus]